MPIYSYRSRLPYVLFSGLRVILKREVGDLRAVVLRLRELGWSVGAVLGHSKGERLARKR